MRVQSAVGSAVPARGAKVVAGSGEPDAIHLVSGRIPALAADVFQFTVFLTKLASPNTADSDTCTSLLHEESDIWFMPLH